MDRFDRIAIQIKNLNPEVALHFMLLALRPNKFTDIWCKKPYSNMDELHEQAKRNIQMEEMSMFWNEVQQAWHKREKGKSSERTDSYKLDKQHKLDKHQPVPIMPNTALSNIQIFFFAQPLTFKWLWKKSEEWFLRFGVSHSLGWPVGTRCSI